VVKARLLMNRGSYSESLQLVSTPLPSALQRTDAEVYASQRQSGKAEQEFGLAVGMVQNARDSIQSTELRLSFLSSAIEFYDAYVDFLIGQHRPLDALKIADRSCSESMEQSLSSTGKSASAAGRFMNPQDTARGRNAALFFYWLGRQRSWLWVVTPAKISLLPLPPAGELQTLVDSYRKTFIDDPRDPLEAGNADGKKLYATLIQPAEKLIAKNSRVVILPDGSLNSLNFETLIVSSPQAENKPHYWIEDATVLTANSLTLLARGSIAVPPRVGNMLMVGEALAASPEFPPLPEAGKEVELLEKYFGESQRLELLGNNATSTAFLASQPEKL
jgi:CHAT domain-containing protein